MGLGFLSGGFRVQGSFPGSVSGLLSLLGWPFRHLRATLQQDHLEPSQDRCCQASASDFRITPSFESQPVDRETLNLKP